MSDLTKKDIKDIVSGALEQSFPPLFEKTFEPFASAIQGEFKKIDERFNKVDEKLIKIDDDIIYMHGRFYLIERELSYIKQKLENVIYRHEFENLKDRIETIEKKVGIKN